MRGLARCAAVVILDGSIVALTLVAALALRMQGDIPEFMLRGLRQNIAPLVLIALVTFYFTGLYRRAWRYVSIPDLVFLVKVVTLAELAMAAAVVLTERQQWLPTSVPLIHWSLAIVALVGVRIARRSLREAMRARQYRRGMPAQPHFDLDTDTLPSWHPTGNVSASRALIIGSADWAESLLEQIERYHAHSFLPVGLIDPVGQDTHLAIHGIPLLGSLDGFEGIVDRLASQGRRPHCVIVNAADPLLAGAQMVQLVARAERLGLEIARAPNLTQIEAKGSAPLDLEFLNFSDLLGRPEQNLDSCVVREALCGRRVMVTGAGGSIGSELARQIAAFAPAKLILLDAGEFNLYAIDMQMRENFPDVPIESILCSIRQREHVMAVFAEHLPEMVFHAAALKHVPLVEQNPCSGVQTNVIGTRIIADAARHYNARAMIQVSTDKAVNPVGMMGASKRLGELYCQALDLAADGRPDATRFMTVRFGNVLGSSGSLIPLFMRQLAQRGPLTVTHPDIERFFMTIHEAVHLILHSSAQALNGAIERGRIFVLDMGEPVKIVDIAERMIRLAGLEPHLDVKIDFVGLRPGEKLYEELFDEHEQRQPSSLPGIFEARPAPVPLSFLRAIFDEIEQDATLGDAEAVKILVRAVLDYTQADAPRAIPAYAPAEQIVANFGLPLPASRRESRAALLRSTAFALRSGIAIFPALNGARP